MVPSISKRRAASIIAAHTTSIATLTLSATGNMLATSSEKGTLVRVWDAYSGSLIKELRRGTDQAEIYGVAFRPDEQELCVWSDKGTVHIFTLQRK
jgi:WD40 repeat protein